MTTIRPAPRALRDRLRADRNTAMRDRQAEWRDAAVEAWRNTPEGDGRLAFFVLASSLARSDRSLAEIATILQQEALFVRNPAERRKEIKSILRKLGQRSLKAVA